MPVHKEMQSRFGKEFIDQDLQSVGLRPAAVLKPLDPFPSRGRDFSSWGHRGHLVLDRILNRLEEWIIVTLIAMATMLTFVAVVHRYGASNSANARPLGRRA